MTETAYVRCLMSNMNKPFRSRRYPTGFFKIPEFEGTPSETPFIMFMESRPGPGRGRHEKKGGWVKTGALTLGEALDHPEFSGVAENYKRKLVDLVRSLIEEGSIGVEELGL